MRLYSLASSRITVIALLPTFQLQADHSSTYTVVCDKTTMCTATRVKTYQFYSTPPTMLWSNTRSTRLTRFNQSVIAATTISSLNRLLQGRLSILLGKWSFQPLTFCNSNVSKNAIRHNVQIQQNTYFAAAWASRTENDPGQIYLNKDNALSPQHVRTKPGDNVEMSIIVKTDNIILATQGKTIHDLSTKERKKHNYRRLNDQQVSWFSTNPFGRGY